MKAQERVEQVVNQQLFGMPLSPDVPYCFGDRVGDTEIMTRLAAAIVKIAPELVEIDIDKAAEAIDASLDSGSNLWWKDRLHLAKIIKEANPIKVKEETNG